MKNLLFSLLLISTSVSAHDEHDWRHDYEAYLNVEVDTTPTPFRARAEKRIDMDFFKEKLAEFTKNERESTKSLDVARKFLTDEYTKLGFEVSLHPFRSGSNFIAEKKGTKPNKILILSSHIDTVGNKGANDNGTGTIGNLAIAKVLASQEFDHTIRILGFDREEDGMKGSDAYVATIQDKKSIIGNINFEMMGHNSKKDGAFHVIDCDKPLFFNVKRPESEFLSKEVKASVVTQGLNLKVVKTCTGRSDHASFWGSKIPAIVISENFFGGDPDPCYHEKCDVMDSRLNYPYMERIMEAVLHATEKLLGKTI